MSGLLYGCSVPASRSTLYWAAVRSVRHSSSVWVTAKCVSGGDDIALAAHALTATITSAGLATAVKLGTTTITATYSSFPAASAALTVTPAGFAYTGNLNTPRFFHSATLLDNGTVLVAGGNDGTEQPLASAELYDPTTGVFTYTDNLTTPYYYPSAVLLNNGNVLIVGGDSTFVGTANLYNPATGRLSTAAVSLPSGSSSRAGWRSSR